jgi:trans-aconitate methyltransferase
MIRSGPGDAPGPDNPLMSFVFGEVAGLYDRARPGYLPELADITLAYAGRLPAHAAEVGAGTGKGTALFAGRGFPITCIEPDERMSELLRGTGVEIVTSTFEDWKPPAGGVDLLFAATAWHWVHPGRRANLAARALAPGGTIALIGRMGRRLDATLDQQITEVFHRFPPATGDRAALPEWAVPELRASPSLTDITVWETKEDSTLKTGAYLDQLQTLSPFRRRTPENQENLLAELRKLIEAHGGTINLRTVTSLVLARKVGG